MRHYKVNRRDHVVYDDLDEVPRNVQVKEDWRDGRVGDWVKSDDGCVIQVLRRGKMKDHKRTNYYVGTCTGTFICFKKTEMDTQLRNNIYSFGGHEDPYQIVQSRTKLNANEKLFVQYLVQGLSPEDSYLRAFPTNKRPYARMKSVELIKTERVMKAMKEELKPILEELEINEKSVLSGIKHEADTAEKSDTRLKALFKLSDILDLEDKNAPKVQQLTGIQFQGFTDEELDTIDRKRIGEKA